MAEETLKIVTLNSVCLCGKESKKRCSKCGIKGYCSVECQKKDWVNHKNECAVDSFDYLRKIEVDSLIKKIYEKVHKKGEITTVDYVSRVPMNCKDIFVILHKFTYMEGVPSYRSKMPHIFHRIARLYIDEKETIYNRLSHILSENIDTFGEDTLHGVAMFNRIKNIGIESPIQLEKYTYVFFIIQHQFPQYLFMKFFLSNAKNEKIDNRAFPLREEDVIFGTEQNVIVDSTPVVHTSKLIWVGERSSPTTPS